MKRVRNREKESEREKNDNQVGNAQVEEDDYFNWGTSA